MENRIKKIQIVLVCQIEIAANRSKHLLAAQENVMHLADQCESKKKNEIISTIRRTVESAANMIDQSSNPQFNTK